MYSKAHSGLCFLFLLLFGLERRVSGTDAGTRAWRSTGLFPPRDLVIQISDRYCIRGQFAFYLAAMDGVGTYSSHPRPFTWASSSSVITLPLVKYPENSVQPYQYGIRRRQKIHTCGYFRIYFNPGIRRDQIFGKLYSFVDWNSRFCHYFAWWNWVIVSRITYP